MPTLDVGKRSISNEAAKSASGSLADIAKCRDCVCFGPASGIAPHDRGRCLIEEFANEMLWKRQATGRGMLAAFSPKECFQQIVQEHCLAFQDLKSRLGNAKPGRPVDLWK